MRRIKLAYRAAKLHPSSPSGWESCDSYGGSITENIKRGMASTAATVGVAAMGMAELPVRIEK
jgi:hypothetical protein